MQEKYRKYHNSGLQYMEISIKKRAWSAIICVITDVDLHIYLPIFWDL
jgi:hypothetical protein